jgi:hypothetical protein
VANIVAVKCKLTVGQQRWDQTRGTTLKGKPISAIEITGSSVVRVLTWQYVLITLGAALLDQETDGTLWVQSVQGRKFLQKQQLLEFMVREFVPRLSNRDASVIP